MSGKKEEVDDDLSSYLSRSEGGIQEECLQKMHLRFYSGAILLLPGVGGEGDRDAHPARQARRARQERSNTRCRRGSKGEGSESRIFGLETHGPEEIR